MSRATPAEAPGRTLNMTSRDDVSYLEALVDNAPRLLGRRDSPDSLTDFWRSVLRALITVTKENMGDAGAHDSTRGKAGP